MFVFAQRIDSTLERICFLLPPPMLVEYCNGVFARHVQKRTPGMYLRLCTLPSGPVRSVQTTTPRISNTLPRKPARSVHNSIPSREYRYATSTIPKRRYWCRYGVPYRTEQIGTLGTDCRPYPTKKFGTLGTHANTLPRIPASSVHSSKYLDENNGAVPNTPLKYFLRSVGECA